MEQWKNAVACQLQKCSNWEQLQHLWNAITFDHTQHNKQYAASVLPFLEKIRLKSIEAIPKEPHSNNFVALPIEVEHNSDFTLLYSYGALDI